MQLCCSVYCQQLDLRRKAQHSSHVCQRFLPQSAQSDPQRPLRYRFKKKKITTSRNHFTLHLQQNSVLMCIFSAPCQPEGITGYLDCVTNSAWISWDAAAGADSYSVAAVSGRGYTGNCSTSSNSTCEVEDLECGVLYSFTVTAGNSQCDSQPSSSIDLQTGA